jgi:hypothetical protein
LKFATNALLVLVLLAACTQVVTLYPRGGGHVQATGTLDDGSRKIEVSLGGKTYSGTYAPASSFTFGPGGSYTGGSQYAALLTAPAGGSLRCEFVLGNLVGNGVCVDDAGRTYDMLVK